jgi:hypothetical protein
MTSVTSSFRRLEVSRPEKYYQHQNEIDKMKERSEKNKFVYIIIPAVPFIVSYKVVFFSLANIFDIFLLKNKSVFFCPNYL